MTCEIRCSLASSTAIRTPPNSTRPSLANPALRLLLHKACLPELNDPVRFRTVRDALISSRDDVEPNWATIKAPIAELGGTGADSASRRHRQLDPGLWRSSAAVLEQERLLPAYAAFNLVTDPDLDGLAFLPALIALNSRSHKKSTLLFNLVRMLIARSLAEGVTNPY